MAETKEKAMRVNTRIPKSQHDFVKNEAKKSKGRLFEADVYREILTLGIEAYKNKIK